MDQKSKSHKIKSKDMNISIIESKGVIMLQFINLTLGEQFIPMMETV